jgi:hypothetical protein
MVFGNTYLTPSAASGNYAILHFPTRTSYTIANDATVILSRPPSTQGSLVH